MYASLSSLETFWIPKNAVSDFRFGLVHLPVTLPLHFSDLNACLFSLLFTLKQRAAYGESPQEYSMDHGLSEN